jgi:MFS family permease
VPFVSVRFGLPRPEAAAIASLGFFGWAVGAPLTGWISDRIGRRRPPLFAGTAAVTVLMLAVVYAPGLTVATMGALFFAVGLSGATMIMTFAGAREHNAAATSGAALGFVNTGTVASGALAQPLIGWLLDRGWAGELADGARIYPVLAYEHALLLLPAWSALAFLLSLFYRETWCRQAA